MYEKIVVPLDGSKLAEAALPYAEELAAKMSSDIILLTVLESDNVGEYEKQRIYTKRIVQVTKYHAEKYIDNGNGAGKAIKIGATTRNGNPAEGIVEYVSKGNVDLIVMASHGRSGFTRWAVGSVADKVVRAAARQPVMLIRANKSRSDLREKRILKKALVPLDGSELSRAVLPYISKIAAKLEMEITLLQVVPLTNHTHVDPEAYLQSECRRLETEGVTAGYKLCAGAVADQIVDLADDLAFDLVAMSTHGRGGVSCWSLGSIAEKVFLGGNTPLLLVKHNMA